ncbi:protein ANTAGONIST OF LIKE HETEROCHROMATIN PROTEIN 1-like [Salvia divinorum]|uniref:Protein ANTAGONIST OF LIKE HETEROCHROMATIN PROTEIN 1-like n=1 Tax=Salvia divinorum TaxID=28513 RepID=A0ABD1HAH6_SALDI
MAPPLSTSTTIYVLLEDIMNLFHLQTTILLYFYLRHGRRMRRHHRRHLIRHYSLLNRIPPQVQHMNRLVSVSDIDCLVNLRYTPFCCLNPNLSQMILTTQGGNLLRGVLEP